MASSRAGIYAATASIIVTVGLGVVGAAGADPTADAHVYALDSGNLCFSTDPQSACPAGEVANVTINPGDTVTFHFDGTDYPHNAEGTSPVAWQIPEPPPEYADEGSYPKPFSLPGTYPFVCALHGGMTGTIIVTGATPTATTTATATSTATPTVTATATAGATATASPQPSGGGTTPAPTTSGGADTVKPSVRGLQLKALRRAVRVRFQLSESATVTVRVKRVGSRTVLTSARKLLRAGTRDVTLRSQKLKKGRYTVEIQARDAYGNRSTLAKKQVRVK